MIKPFTLGAIGSLISAVSTGIIFVIDLFPVVIPLFSATYGSFYFYNLIQFFLPILLGVGILLASFGYRGLRKKFGLLFGTVGFAFGVVASVFIFSAAVIGLVTPDFVILVYPPPLIYSINSLVRLLATIFFGLTYLVWGVAHFKSKKFSKKPNFSLVTVGLFVVSGVVTVSIFYAYIGLALSIIGLLFASKVFFTFQH